jgi:hypothetical protein
MSEDFLLRPLDAPPAYATAAHLVVARGRVTAVLSTGEAPKVRTAG